MALPSPPARVGNPAQACTDRQTLNTPGRRRVAGHGFSRGTARPPPPSPPPAGKVQVSPKASRPRGEGQGRGAPKTTAEAVACYTTGTWESVGPLGLARTGAPTGSPPRRLRNLLADRGCMASADDLICRIFGRLEEAKGTSHGRQTGEIRPQAGRAVRDPAQERSPEGEGAGAAGRATRRPRGEARTGEGVGGAPWRSSLSRRMPRQRPVRAGKLFAAVHIPLESSRYGCTLRRRGTRPTSPERS